jgi:hypothetical protein
MTSGDQDAPAARGLSTSAKLAIAAATAAVAVLMAVVAVVVVDRVFFSPEKQVEKYATALEDGDADRLRALARGAYSPKESVLLTDEVLAGMEEPIRDIEVHSIATDGDRSSVAITYSQGTSASFLTVELRKSGSRLGVFDEWTIVDPDLPTLDVRADGATGLEVNGKVVDVADQDGAVELPVFPGSYDVTPTSGSRFLAFETKSASVGVLSEIMGFDATTTEELHAEVARLADAYLARCLARREARPEGCPNRTFGHDLQDVRWQLATSPTYRVKRAPSGAFRFTASAGAAHATAKEPGLRAGLPAKDYFDTVTLDFGGTIQVDGDTVVIEADRF